VTAKHKFSRDLLDRPLSDVDFKHQCAVCMGMDFVFEEGFLRPKALVSHVRT
jgi:hypothetical protein